MKIIFSIITFLLITLAIVDGHRPNFHQRKHLNHQFHKSYRHHLKFFQNHKSPTKSCTTKILPKPTCVENVLCKIGHKWDRSECKCVPMTTTTTTALPTNTCRPIFCLEGYKWDQSECRCIQITTTTASPRHTCPIIHCPNNYHVDPSDCKCIPPTAYSTDPPSPKAERQVDYRLVTRPYRDSSLAYPKYASNPAQ
ncbi:25109_t:CDS:2 [Cetraspora pellucida]|uniref:25109_t:CDS:1 n=1 Tax=Cetraspora pellucida TaxID=1433469 RepID=A0A9N9IH93_9GLOM|nr:25109_t:CDS:2 [Cetraspora pellucida]